MITIDIDAPKTCNGCFAAHWHDNTNAFCAIELDKDFDDTVISFTDILHHMYHDTKPDWCPIKDAEEPNTGEWICKGDYAMCSKCGGLSDTQFDGVERIPKTTAFCPHCGAKMLGKYRLKKEVK